MAAWAPTTIIHGGDLVGEVERLRDAHGGVVNVMGSATVPRTLLAADLVDELQLMIEPAGTRQRKRIWLMTANCAGSI